MSIWRDYLASLGPYAWYLNNEPAQPVGLKQIDHGTSGIDGQYASANITYGNASIIPGDDLTHITTTAGGQIDSGIIDRNAVTGFTIVTTWQATAADISTNGRWWNGGIQVTVGATNVLLTDWSGPIAPQTLGPRAPLIDGNPHLCVFTIIDGQQLFYLDGVLQAAGGTASGAPITGSTLFRFSRGGASDYFGGHVQGIAFFHGIFDQTDIDDLYDRWLGLGLGTPVPQATPGRTNIWVTWDPIENATGYNIRINGGASTDVGDVLSHEFTGLTEATPYLVEVQAYNDEGASSWGPVNVTTLDMTFEVTIDGEPPTVTDDLCHLFGDLTPGSTHELCVTACTEEGCSDEVCISATTLAPAQGWSPCPCGPGWRIEVCNLRTGVIRGILLPTAMDFQVMKNTVGRGSLTLPVRAVRALDVWPDFTSVYITREGMDPFNDDCLFAGIVREANGENGTVTVGMESIESYLWRRRLLRDLSFTDVGQNQIAAALVAETVANGIPLTGSAQTPGAPRTRDYLEADRAYIGPLLEQFTESLDGPSWRLEHSRSGGAWSTRIVFADTVGDDRDTVLKGDWEGTDYGLNLNSQDHATWIDGFNQASPPLTSHADDLTIYPAFDADPTFDAPLQGTLDEQTQGYLNVRGDIAAIPSFTLSGEAITAAQMRLGDTAEFHLDQGFIAFHGRAQVAGITYRIAEGSPLTRDLALIPVDTAVDSVMNATSTDQCQSCR